jgi:hypothetical protein
MEELDREVLAAIAGDVLEPGLVDEVVTAAKQMFKSTRKAETTTHQRRELARLEREQARLTDAIAAGADAPAVIARLKATETKRRELVTALETARTCQAPAWEEIEKRVRQRLTDWRSLLTGDVPQVRVALRQLLTTPVTFTPFVKNGRRGVRFEGRVGLQALFGGDWVMSFLRHR